MQQEQHDEAAFAEAVRREACGAVTIDRAGQGEQLETQAQLRDIGVTPPLRLLDEGLVLQLKHRESIYD
ncbi:hypothetical protein D3C73_1662350 [compost metagenome]